MFDVDSRTGFMPPKPPIARLPAMWEDWERMLDLAIASKLKCGDQVGLTPEDAANSEAWRAQVRKVRHFVHCIRVMSHTPVVADARTAGELDSELLPAPP